MNSSKLRLTKSTTPCLKAGVSVTILDDEEINYIYSLLCIVLAVLFIVAGFKFKLKAFRLYGLSLAIACVLKLVFINISYTNSITQVVSFIVSGLLCFGIVGIYNIAQARFDK